MTREFIITTYAILLTILCAAAGIWYIITPAADITYPQKAPELQDVGKIEHPGPVKVYASKAKSKLNLPKEVKDNQAISVVDAVATGPSRHSSTIVTTLDDRTGEFSTFIMQKPLPLFAATKTGEARIDYGIKNGAPEWRLSLSRDLLQIKTLDFGVAAAVYGDGTYFAGVGISYKW